MNDHGRYVYENYIDNIPYIDDTDFIEKINDTKLNLGCGSDIIEGWANIDLKGDKRIIRCNLANPLPIS